MAIIDPEYELDKWEVSPTMIIANADHYYTKPQTDAKIAEMSGATPEQVEGMINESLQDYYDKAEINTTVNDLEDSDSVISGAVGNVSSALTQEAQRAQNVENELSGILETKAYSSAVTEEINAAVSGKADSSAVTEAISAAVSGKADSSAVTEEINAAVSGKADSSAVTQEISASLSGKADTSAVTEAISAAVSGKADSSAVTQEVSAAVSGKADSSAVTEEINAAVSGKADSDDVYTKTETNNLLDSKQDTLIAGENITISGNVISSTGGSGGLTPQEAQTMIDESISGKADTTAVTEAISSAVSGKANSDDVYTKTETNSLLESKQNVLEAGENITISGNVISSTGGGLTPQEAQTMIDQSISGKANTNDVYTKAQTDSAITASVSGKANSDDVYTKRQTDDAIGAAVSGKTDKSTTQTLSNTLGGHTADTTIHVTQQNKNTWNAKQDALVAGDNITISGNVISSTGGGISSGEVQTMIEEGISGHTANTTIHVTAQDKTNWNSKSDFSGNYNDLTNKPNIPNYTAGTGISISGNTISAKIWSGTLAQYNALTNKDNDTIYLILS